MAATAFDGLADVYTAVTPALPFLYKWELEVLGNRKPIPYALLVQLHGADELLVQQNAAVSGAIGLRHEALWARFWIWSTVPADADSAASRLAGALHPKSIVVTGAKTYTQARDTMVGEARHRPPRLGARPIPRGAEVSGDRVYAANVDVKVRIDYD